MFCRHLTLSFAVAIGLALSGTLLAASRPASPTGDDRHVAVSTADGTVVAAYERSGRIHRLSGAAMARGATPLAAVERFLRSNAALVGVERAALRPFSVEPGAGHAHGLMYDPEAGAHRFTVLHYEQWLDDVPVFSSRVTLLVRNEATHPLVLVNPDVRDIGGLRIDPAEGAAGPNAAGIAAALDHVQAVSTLVGEPSLFSSRKVIWAGTGDEPALPALADEMIVRLDADEWRVLTDARRGDVLYEEQVVCLVDVDGTVSGRATEGPAAEQCADEVAIALPYARVDTFDESGQQNPVVAFTGADGLFVLTGLADGLVTINASLLGLWFDVFNYVGEQAVETIIVTPPATVDFLFNAANDDEQVRAQVNAYLQANRVRDWVLAMNPDYPTLQNDGFPVNVNRTDGFCPGNAWYSNSGGPNINFCLAGGNFTNTAFSSVVQHEYGHHLVFAGGSGQAAYGEGMADVIALVMLDEPELGVGFRIDECDSGIRNADNDLQYPCFGEIHYCGQLLSGCVWDIRNELVGTNPDTYLDILGALCVNSILLHSGNSIDPGISIDFLTLDDDNETIYDGTPHFDEITAGFAAHDMLAPELALLEISFPDGRPEPIPPSGAAVRVEVAGVFAEPQPGTGVLHYDDGGGVVPIPMVEVAPNVYDAMFPPAECRTRVSYFFSAETTDGRTVYAPDAAPAESYDAVVAIAATTYFLDDSEIDWGWSLENVDLTGGSWERGVPAGNGDRGDPVIDFDGSGQCWLTGNQAGDSDVDGGPTRLISPIFDLSILDDPEIRYARWFTNSDQDEDRLDVHVSGDGGQTWALAESVSNEPAGWRVGSIRVSDFLTVELSDVRVRFSATDNPNNSVVEAAIDALEVLEFECAPSCSADVDGNGDVGFRDLIVVLSAWGPCQQDCSADVDGDGDVDGDDLGWLIGDWGRCP